MKRTQLEAAQEVNKLQVDIRANYRRIAQIEQCLSHDTCEGCRILCEMPK
jgi:hypothetical protein